MSMPAKVYVTFGERYREKGSHPDKRVHPDGWWEVEGHDENTARVAAERLFRGYGDVLIGAKRPDPDYLVLGRLVFLEASEGGVVFEVQSWL